MHFDPSFSIPCSKLHTDDPTVVLHRAAVQRLPAWLSTPPTQGHRCVRNEPLLFPPLIHAIEGRPLLNGWPTMSRRRTGETAAPPDGRLKK
jgi:hypothetical protein